MIGLNFVKIQINPNQHAAGLFGMAPATGFQINIRLPQV